MESGIRHGIVAFFDILGYRNILINNEPEIIAAKTIRILSSLRRIVVKHILLSELKRMLDAESVGIVAPKWTIFSDTIILTLETPESIDELTWMIMTLWCAVLQQSMLENGLPVRGAISAGDYYLRGNAFAGRPFVDAYDLANQLDLAACVVHEKAHAMILSPPCENDALYKLFLQGFAPTYLVPFKDRSERKLPTLNSYICNSWYSISDDESILAMMPFNIRQLFWEHGKDISLSVDRKVTNTIKFMEYMVHQWEELRDNDLFVSIINEEEE